MPRDAMPRRQLSCSDVVAGPSAKLFTPQKLPCGVDPALKMRASVLRFRVLQVSIPQSNSRYEAFPSLLKSGGFHSRRCYQT
jgi:hypothetical protein